MATALAARIEELKAAQIEIVRQTRLAAIGEIAAVVAHEVRNPLGALANCVQLLRTGAQLSGDNAELLDIVRTESERLNRIVSDFLAFGRSRPPSFQPVDLRELIEETWAQLRRDERCPTSIVFAPRFGGDLLKVQADPDQLRQVFWNLFLNAAQAMAAGGTLSVESRRRADAIDIEIRDTGAGISEAALPRVFEPFYSWHVRAPYPERLLIPLFQSRSIGSTSFTRYGNPVVDRFLESALRLPEQQQLYAQAQRQIVEDAPMLFLYHGTRMAAVGERVRGISLNLSAAPHDKLVTVDIRP
jgi:light-regulated signal transduction histidine kinase (bacteriophytochrome)